MKFVEISLGMQKNNLMIVMNRNLLKDFVNRYNSI